MEFNPLDFLYTFFFRLADMITWIYNFLFTQVTIGSWSFTPIFALGTGTIVTLIIAKLIKEFVPLV